MAAKIASPKLLILAVAIAAAGLIFWQFQKSGQRQTQVQVSVPTLTAEAEQGRGLFEANCVACHGKNAGGSEKGPPLVHIIYEPNHHADRSFLAAARFGVRAHHWRFGNMPPVPGIADEQVVLITKYVRELQRANGIN